MKKTPRTKQSNPTRFKTTLSLPVDLWKRTKIAAIEADKDATDLVIEALEEYLKKGGRS
jgi:hypothetical protein